MKKILLIFVVLTYYNSMSFCQIDLNFEKNKILKTGLKLYKLEKAAWISSDSLQKKINEINFSGYVSYFLNDTIKTIFYKSINEKDFQVLYAFDFDTTINVKYLKFTTKTRPPKKEEKKYIELKEETMGILSYFEGMYGKHKNTENNIAIIKEEGKYKIYSMTGTTINGILPIGNDFQFECKENENTLDFIGKLHQNYIPINMNDMPKDTKAGFHNHSFKSSKFMTPTDICILLLYKDFSPVDEHIVASRKYVSVFNIKMMNLSIMLKKEYNKLNGTNL